MTMPDPPRAPRTAQEWANIAAGYYERLPRLEAEVDETKSAAIAAVAIAKEARDAALRIEAAMNGHPRPRQPSAHDVDLALERLDHRLDELEETTSPGMLTRAELEARLAARERDSMRVKIEILEKEKASKEDEARRELHERRKRAWFVVGGLLLFVGERIVEALLKGHL